MKLFRSTLTIAAAALTALTLYFAYAAPTTTGLAEVASTSTVSSSRDLAPARALVKNTITLVAKVVDARKRIVELGTPRDATEDGIKSRTTGDRPPVDEAVNNVKEPARQPIPLHSASKQAAVRPASALNIVVG
jgi:Mg2+/Co2+ transporter CorB